MTMEAPPNEIEYLSKQIIINDKPVTYHTLSREQDIHVNHAKKILLEFYHKNRDKVKASFVITGTYEEKTLIKFAPNEIILQEWVSKYEKIHTIQIYSLSRSEVSGEELAMEDLKFPIMYEKVAQYVKNGMIKGPEFKMDVVEQKREAPKTVRDTKPIKTVKEEPKLVNAGLSSSYISRKAKPERTNTLSNYTSRKDENSKKRVQPTSTGYQYKSRKLETKAPKERVVIADANDEVAEEEPTRPTKISSSELDKMFEDDFSDEEDTNGTPKETIQEIPKGSEEKPEESNEEPQESNEEPQESNEEPQEISNKIPQDSNPEEPMFVEEEPPSPPPIVEDTIDEDGFITTYRKAPAASTKPVERKKPTPTSKPKTAINKKNDGKKMQSSLMGFFKPRKST